MDVTIPKYPCTFDDLRVEITADMPIHANGLPLMVDTSAYDIVGDQPYFCVNCDGNFETIEEATKHLESAEQLELDPER